MSLEKKSGFGTLPVFLTAISTILGAVMFLRFGFSVGSVGFGYTVLIVIIGHLVTIPTAMALAEIATNSKVEGGGEYFIISRSFGINIGAAIGIALFMSQAISVAFYIIAFAEAFTALEPWLRETFNIALPDMRFFSVPALVLLILLMVTKGADLGMKMLYIVVAILGVSLIFFFLGGHATSEFTTNGSLFKEVKSEHTFFYVFAIIFPAFTGMTAGVGLSGDLRDPSKSIPRGTIFATVAGMIIYILMAYKLYTSASLSDLKDDQLIMQQIAIWGPIIPIGLAAATISSAIGSFMVAPRTLQALAGDQVFPGRKMNLWLSAGVKENNEPRNGTIVTALIALVFVLMGDVNAVAEIISMFFMVTYGSLCLISFFQHFSGDPSYRPTFKSRWYISLLGALMCIYLMFKINSIYAIAAILLMVGIYFGIGLYLKTTKGMAQIFQGVFFQFVRSVQVFLQKSEKDISSKNWRPSIVCLSQDTFEHNDALDLMQWITQKYGFGTYIHYHKGYYSKDTKNIAQQAMVELKGISKKSNVFLDTLISPSNTSAIVQVLQQPSVSGHENNMLLLEFEQGNKEWLEEIVENYNLIKTAKHDVAVLSISSKGFGRHKEIHVWIKREDVQNGNMMILMAYIISAHKDWKKSHIKIFAAFPAETMQAEKENLIELTQSGRLPISAFNITVLELKEDTNIKDLISENSKNASLTIIGFHESRMKTNGTEVFKGYDRLGNILFLNTLERKNIS
jgi:solute carrier family 12 (sodium/potassium/chloride transporter), member 2